MADPNDVLQQLAQLSAEYNRRLQQLAATTASTTSTISSSGQVLGSNIRSVGQGMARLRTDLDRGRGSISSHAQTLRVLQDDYDNLRDEVKATAAGQAIFVQQQKMASDLLSRTAGDLSASFVKAGISEAISYFKNQLITSIKSVQDNVGGMQAAFNLQNAAIDSQIQLLNRLGEGLQGASLALATVPGITAKIGAGVALTAGVLVKLAGTLSDLEKEAITILQTELIKTEAAFKVLTGSGVLLAGGMDETRAAAAVLKLDLKDLSVFVNSNAEALARLGGSVQQGLKRFSMVTTSLEPFRVGLLNLGYSYTEQAQGQADYMDMLQQAGELSLKSPEQLAKGTAAYLVNLRAISSFTGEEAKRAQQRSREASTQLAVQSKLQGMGAGAMERFRSGIENMEPFMQKALQQATAFDGTVVDQSLNQLFALSPAREELFRRSQQNMQDLSLDASEITRRYQADVRELGPAMAAEARDLGDSLGAANLAIGSFPELTKQVEATLQLGIKGTALLEQSTQNTVDAANALKTTTDLLTTEVSRAAQTFANATAILNRGLTPLITDYALKGPPGPIESGLNESVIKSSENIVLAIEKIGIPLNDTLRKIGNLTPSEQSTDQQINNSVVDRMFGLIPRFQGGGIAQGPASGYLSMTHGREAVIPLGSGDTVGVELRSPTGLIEGAMQKAQAQIGLNNKSIETVQTTLQTMFDNPNLLSRSIGELKQQVASDNQMSQSIMKQYTDKMDTLIATLQDNVEYSRRIANDIS